MSYAEIDNLDDEGDKPHMDRTALENEGLTGEEIAFLLRDHNAISRDELTDRLAQWDADLASRNDKDPKNR